MDVQPWHQREVHSWYARTYTNTPDIITKAKVIDVKKEKKMCHTLK